MFWISDLCWQTNYQAAVWRQSLQRCPDIPSPVGSGWCTEDGKLVIDWRGGQPALQAVLEVLSCQCSRSCKLPSCSCIVNGLKFTDICHLQDCTNKPEDDNVLKIAIGKSPMNNRIYEITFLHKHSQIKEYLSLFDPKV